LSVTHAYRILNCC